MSVLVLSRYQIQGHTHNQIFSYWKDILQTVVFGRLSVSWSRLSKHFVDLHLIEKKRKEIRQKSLERNCVYHKQNAEDGRLPE